MAGTSYLQRGQSVGRWTQRTSEGKTGEWVTDSEREELTAFSFQNGLLLVFLQNMALEIVYVICLWPHLQRSECNRDRGVTSSPCSS